jgi:PKD repeat protein
MLPYGENYPYGDSVLYKDDSSVADFTYTPDEGNTPLTVQFTDTSVGNTLTWLWDFGDTETSTQQNPIHVYPYAGIYSIFLTITGVNESVPYTYTVKKYDIIVVNFEETVQKIEYIKVSHSVATPDTSVSDDHGALKYMVKQGTGGVTFFKNTNGVRCTISNIATSFENTGFKRAKGPTIIFD